MSVYLPGYYHIKYTNNNNKTKDERAAENVVYYRKDNNVWYYWDENIGSDGKPIGWKKSDTKDDHWNGTLVEWDYDSIQTSFLKGKPENGGSLKRKTSKKSVKKEKESPIKTNKTHKCKDGKERKLYKKGGDMYVKMKSQVTGKMIFKKIKL